MEKKHITLKPDAYYPVSDVILGGLERYLNHGIAPGSFLTAVLCNDLSDAFGRADCVNSANLKNIVSYVYHHIPYSAWGSREKVEAFMRQASRREQMSNPNQTAGS